MASNSVFRWQDGRGWLVLSGGHDDDDEIRARALERMAADGGLAYVAMGTADAEVAERILDDMVDLGAPSGYLVDVLSEDDDSIYARLADAGMIVLGNAADVLTMRTNLHDAVLRGILAAFENGALILAEGNGAAVLAAWILAPNGQAEAGIGWLENSLVIPAITSVKDEPRAKAFLLAEPAGIAIGIGVGSALAFGPDGELEPWGKREVTIALGARYGA